MDNKIIIGILVLLVVLSGVLGSYSYALNQQINSLGEQLAVFQMEQAILITDMSSELTDVSKETSTKVDDLKDGIDSNFTQIDALKDEIDENIMGIDTLRGEIDENLSRIDTLGDEIRDTAELSQSVSQSVMDANKVYQRVSQATVRISNGDSTIGSGFVIDREGHVVTAQHVVENLSTVYVVFSDGRVSEATNIASCRRSDIAVLTIEDELDIEPPPLADSDTVRIGEPVATIGNPFNLTETLTIGIVSQTNRFIEIEYDAQNRWVPNLIQFDAAVNFGNSGGPLVNSKGEVIGLVIARIGPDEGDGIYYAISSNKLKRVTDSLIAQGSFDYPWLGVTIMDITPQMVQDRNLETVNGILVEGILADSPAATAGIEVDDIIIAIDGLALRDVAELTSYLGEHKSPGDATIVTLLRDNSKKDIFLEIGTRP